MIFFISVKLKEIVEKGRDYPWPKPKVCLRCRDSKLWGHGFVESYFQLMYLLVFQPVIITVIQYERQLIWA